MLFERGSVVEDVVRFRYMFSGWGPICRLVALQHSESAAFWGHPIKDAGYLIIQ
jgi:hypothetical protein